MDWPAFEGEAKRCSFDPQRYMNWRFYWDYSGGNVFENMVHQVGFWYQVPGLEHSRSRSPWPGANYRSPKMEVPDTMTVSMNQPEKVLFTWNSMFGNAYYGETHDYLFGTKGTVMHDESDQVLYLPQGNGRRTRLAPEAEGEQPKRATRITRPSICRTSSTASAAAMSRSAPSRWDSARRLPARWPSPPAGSSGRFAGTLKAEDIV